VTAKIEQKNGQGFVPPKGVLRTAEQGPWLVRDTKLVDLSGSKARVKFRIQSPSELGAKMAPAILRKYRIRVETIEGELSELNKPESFQ